MTLQDFATFYFVIALFVYVSMTLFVHSHRKAFESDWKLVPLYIFVTALVWFIFLPYLIRRSMKRS